MSVDVVTFGCRLNAYESEVIRRAGAGRRARRHRRRQHLRGDGGSGAAGAPDHPQAQARAPAGAHRGHRLRGADRAADLRRHARGRARARQRGEAQRAAWRDSATRSARRVRPRRRGEDRRQRHHGGEGDRRCTSSTASKAARAPSCRCRTAATTAAPSASFPMAAAIRARCRWARWWRRCAGSCAHGYREIVLTGVDITSYGANLPGAPKLGTLVKQILKHVPELERLRLSSIDSVEADRDLLDAFADEPRLMPHLHLSLQAGDDLILKRMKRRHLRADAIAFCDQVRRLRPDVVFGADIIAGFPTETEDDVRPLARPRRRMRADASARVSVLAAARHAGRAHAAGARARSSRSARGGCARRAKRRCAAISTAQVGAHAARAGRMQATLGRTEHFTPVRLAAPVEPGTIVDLAIAGHDGRPTDRGLISLLEIMTWNSATTSSPASSSSSASTASRMARR